MANWKLEGEFWSHETPWVRMMGEHYTDESGTRLEYYRVSKADSVIALAVQAGRVLMPPPQFRPGLQRSTLDFPGGRVDEEAGVEASARRAVERELGITAGAVERFLALDERGWPVNSSFSDQKLFGYIATIRREAKIEAYRSYDLSREGVVALLADVDCLQCRAVFLQYLLWAGRGDLFPRGTAT